VSVQLKRITVARFRGIREMAWTLEGATVCLIGPGDSTKTTILDAMEWALLPRWMMPVSDADFYETATTDPIVIEVTVAGVPDSLLIDQKFGLVQRGWGPDGLHDEPEDDDQSVLTIRLTIDDSLEPRWEVVTDRTDPRPISARDRESLGVTRLGAEVERHLTWGRGSALLRLTDSTEEMGRTLAAAHRKTRTAVEEADLEALGEAADRAAAAAKAMGAGAKNSYVPRLDPGAVGLGAAALGLHDGHVPVRGAGLGSRRLTALAIQRESFPGGGIVLVDELEAGLEPHRLRHLVKVLKAADNGQVIMTTHSEVALVELTVADLRVVTSDDGVTVVHGVGDELQAAVRAVPEALLARRIVVTEGKTEVGLSRALDAFWAAEHGKPLAEAGVVFVPGEGTTRAPAIAMGLAGLGYPTAAFIDSDIEPHPGVEEMQAAGVALFMWADGMSTEERVARDLPFEVVMQLVDRVADLVDEGNPSVVMDAVAARLGAGSGTSPDDWRAAFAEDAIRDAVAETAKAKKWFKRIDHGEILGRVVVEALPQVPDTELAVTLRGVGEWAHAT
jgi:hypothetical protein